MTRAEDRTVVEFEAFRYEVMARSAQRGIDLFTLRLEPGEGPVRDPVSHAGEEAGMVVSGSMDVIVAGASYRLGPGDAIWFVSGQPHTFAAVGDEPCLSVWADTIPDHAAPGGGSSVFDGLIAGTGGSGDARTVLAPPPRAAAARDPLAVARGLEIDADHLRDIVERLSSIGSSPLGFRVTGTPEDREAADLVARELRAIGLDDVALEPVRVDGWRFESARLEPGDGGAIEGAALGGTPPTPPGGIRGRIVDAGGWRRRALDRLDVRGALVLIDWRKGPGGPADAGLELGLRGAAGVIVTPAQDGPYFQAEGALGGFDGHWHAGAPPMMTIRKRDGDALRERLAQGPVEATMTVNAAIAPGAAGSNVVGYLAGDEPGPIVVGAHHDGWFRAAFDNATGVAALIAIARALVAAGHRPRHRICFTSRTAEEWGLLDRAFDWCTGAWRQVNETHPEWGEQAPFHLCLEASGHPDLRTTLVAPVELTRWARAAGKVGEAEGWLTSGWRTTPASDGNGAVAAAPVGRAQASARSTGRRSSPARRTTRRSIRRRWSTSTTSSGSPASTPTCCSTPTATRTASSTTAPARDRSRSRPRSWGPGGAPLEAAAKAHAGARGRAAFTAVGPRHCSPSAPTARPAIRTSRRPPTSRRSRRRSPRSPPATTRPPRASSPRSARTRSRRCSRRRRSHATAPATGASSTTTRGPPAAI